MISVIVPCFNEEAALPFFMPEIRRVMEELRERFGQETEVLFVDDGSWDSTLSLLRQYHREGPG